MVIAALLPLLVVGERHFLSMVEACFAKYAACSADPPSLRNHDIRRGALHRNRFTNGKRKEVGEDNVPPHSHMLACVSYYWSILYTHLLLVNCLNLCMVTPNAWSCCLCMHGLSSSHWSCPLQLLPVLLRAGALCCTVAAAAAVLSLLLLSLLHYQSTFI